MIELRTQVERIVRPIRATAHRKNRMREELLAHLGELYQQELLAHPDNKVAALTVACKRFGEPAALRAELQATVPAVERFLALPLPSAQGRFQRRPGESTLDYTRRTVVWATVINAVVWLLLVLVCAIGLQRERARYTSSGGILTLIAVYVVSFPLLAYGPALLCEQVWRTWQKRSAADGSARRRATVSAALWLSAVLAVYVGSTALFLALMTRAVTYPLVSAFWFWIIISSSALVGLLIALLQMRDLQRWQLWDGLVIDEPSTIERAAIEP